MSLLIGPRNCERETGLPWRHVRDHYRPLAIPIGRKLAIPADALLAAIHANAEQPSFRNAGSGIAKEALPDAAEQVRRALGKRRRA